MSIQSSSAIVLDLPLAVLLALRHGGRDEHSPRQRLRSFGGVHRDGGEGARLFMPGKTYIFKDYISAIVNACVPRVTTTSTPHVSAGGRAVNRENDSLSYWRTCATYFPRSNRMRAKWQEDFHQVAAARRGSGEGSRWTRIGRGRGEQRRR